MVINREIWPALSMYLFIDKKQQRGKNGHNELSSKSRFFIYIDWLNGRGFTRDNFNLFIQEKQQIGNSPSTLNNFIKLVKHIDRFIQLKDSTYQLQFSDYTYFHEYKNPDYEIFSIEEMEATAEAVVPFKSSNRFPADPEDTNRRYKAITEVLLQTGCRINEALYLKYSDILTDELIIFRQTKSHEDRKVFISPQLVKELRAINSPSEYIFASSKGTPPDDSAVNDVLHRKAVIAGITKKFTAHTFRRSFISEMLRLGMPHTDLMKIVGHKNVETLLRYDYREIEVMKNTLYAYHPTFRGSQPFSQQVKRVKEAMSLISDVRNTQLQITEVARQITIILTDTRPLTLLIVGSLVVYMYTYTLFGISV